MQRTTTRQPRYRDAMLPYFSKKCQCTVCHEYFTSVSPFDWHRQWPNGERRCRTREEMALKGMVQNKTGHWMRGKKPAGVVEARQRK